MILRLLYGAGILLSCVLAPWFVTFGIGLLGLVLFNRFWELVAVAFLIDLLYGGPNIRFLDFHFVLTLCAIIALVISQFVRRFLRLPYA